VNMPAKVIHLAPCFRLIQETVMRGGHRDPKRLHFAAHTAQLSLDSYNTYIFQVWSYRQAMKLETGVSVK
jgi:uncharacterized membrane protein (GlpM family)